MKKFVQILIILFAVPVFAQDWTQRVQVLVQAKTAQGDYHDALYFTPEEFAKLAKEDIDKQVKIRVDNWLAFVAEQSSKPPVIPTKEELKESATAQVDQVEKTIAQIIAAKPTKEDVLALIEKLEKQVVDLKTEVGIEVKPVEVVTP